MIVVILLPIFLAETFWSYGTKTPSYKSLRELGLGSFHFVTGCGWDKLNGFKGEHSSQAGNGCF